MPAFSRSEQFFNILLIIVAAGCLFATAMQYPLSTTFPIGGDAAAIISRVQHTLTSPLQTLENIRHTWYPVSYILFSLNAFNPFVYWPTAFSWWMAIGQIITGLTLGLLTYRLAGLKAAALSIAVWAATPITMSSFFEDGTMAQLWSLPWVVLFFERLYARSVRGMILTSLALLFSHPVTAVVFLVSTAIALPHIAQKEKFTSNIFLWSIPVALMGAVLFIYRGEEIFTLDYGFETSKYSYELFRGFFLPWLFASIIGFFAIATTQRKNPIIRIAMGSFFLVSCIIAINDQLGIGFWTNRVNGYLLLCITVAAGIGLASLLQGLKMHVLSGILALLLIVGINMSVINDNKNIYKRYESPSTYSRIHPQELAAIEWMKENLNPSSTVISSTITRFYEWIPVLSPLQWDGLAEYELFSQKKYKTLQNAYIIFFTKKEGVPAFILEHPSLFHEEFRNSAAVLYKISL